MTKAKIKKKIGIKSNPSSVIALKLVLLRHNLWRHRSFTVNTILTTPKIKFLKPYDFWQHQAFYSSRLLAFLEKKLKKINLRDWLKKDSMVKQIPGGQQKNI